MRIRVESARRGWVWLEDVPSNWTIIQLKVPQVKPCSLREMVDEIAPFSPVDSRVYQLEKYYPKLVVVEPTENFILVQEAQTKTKDFLGWADKNSLGASWPYQLRALAQTIDRSDNLDPTCLRATMSSWAGYISFWRGVDSALLSVDDGEELDGATHVFQLCR